MPTSSVCRTAAAAAVAVGSLTFFGAAAGAQTCYPPTPGCVTTTSGPRVSPTSVVRVPDDDDDDDVVTTPGRSSTGNLARTGVTVGATAIIGVGLVAGGVAMKRSAKRGRASSAG